MSGWEDIYNPMEFREGYELWKVPKAEISRVSMECCDMKERAVGEQGPAW